MTDTTVDLLVVGGGLGGLVAAAHAQRGGRSVLVLEQGAVAGGVGRSPQLAGLPMNLGPHALYLGAAAEQAFTALGVPLPGFEPGAGSWLELDGALLPMPNSPLKLLTASWLSWRERVELAMTLRQVSGVGPEGTVAQWLATVRSPRVRAFCELMLRLTTYTNAPELLATRLAWRQLRLLLEPGARGVRYLDGGWQPLADTLAASVPIRFGARVTAVSRGGEVMLEGGEVLRGREVALAVPLGVAARLVDDEGLRQRAAAAAPVRAACLDVVLAQLPRPERRLALGMDEPLYFSVHSRPEMASQVKVHMAWYLRPDDATPAAELQSRLEAFLERVQPGWRAQCEAARFFPHLHVMEDLPREAVTRLATPLRLVSSVATTGFLLDAVVESARLDAPAALDRLGSPA
jgi:phytoene dehydrogenase-like protein